MAVVGTRKNLPKITLINTFTTTISAMTKLILLAANLDLVGQFSRQHSKDEFHPKIKIYSSTKYKCLQTDWKRYHSLLLQSFYDFDKT